MFFFGLVVENLVNFHKVAHVMKAVGFALDDFYLFVHLFQFTDVDGVITMVQDAVAVTLHHLGNLVQSAGIQL